ncbi:MAG TPA: hypothetical protein GX707_10545 [Epulopiscium sp.]|nr:hypothetical protein [Candidatus Epulonipiscium sp.]
MDELHQKQQLLNLILENTQAQTGAIEEDELELLESLISQREGIMRQVDELDLKADTISPKTSEELTGPIKDLLRRIILIDDANQELLDKGVQDMEEDVAVVKEQLRDIRERRRQEESYVPEYGTYREEGVFFDKRE